MSNSVKNSPILEPLKQDSQILQDTVGEFARWANRANLRIHCFYELLETDIVRMASSLTRLGFSSKSILVPRDLACLDGHSQTALNLNHIKLNRFTDPADANYILVSRELQQMWPSSSLKTDCLSSVYFEQLQNRESDINSALKDTATWLFEQEVYNNWACWDTPHSKTRPGLIWIKGKPGSGKSTLMKEALKRARALASASSFSVAAYFFTARSNTLLQKSRLGLFRAILHSLIQQDKVLLSAFASRYQTKRNNASSGTLAWELGELQDFFKSAYSNISDVRQTMLFIDALDESEGEGDLDAYTVARELVYFFYDITAFNQLKVCFSSRHYPQVHVPHCGQIVTEHFNSGDVVRFITAKLFGARHDERAIRLAKTICTKAAGVFLWVILVVQKLNMSLENEMTDHDLQEILKTVPSQLEKLFVDLFAGLSSKSELQTAATIFQWILLARRPLEPNELRHALTIDHTKMTPLEDSADWVLSQNCLPGEPDKFLTSLRGYTRGLTEIRSAGLDVLSQSIYVQFIHESARELFLSGPGFLSLENMNGSTTQHNKSLAERHETVAEYCIACIYQVANYLSTRKGLIGLSHRHPFLKYAVSSLEYHVQQVEQLSSGTRFSNSFVAALLEPDQIFWKTWNLLLERKYRTAFHHLCSQNLLVLAQALLDRGANIDIRNRRHYTALHGAIQSRNSRLVRFLLKNKADPSAGDCHGRTPLHLIATHKNYHLFSTGFFASLEPLLEDHGCLEAVDNDGKTPLHAALENSNLDFAKILLSRGASVDSHTVGGSTPLHVLLQNFGRLRDKVVQSDPRILGAGLLQAMISAGADRNAQDNLGKTPLHYALERPNRFWALPILVLGDPQSVGILDVTKPDGKGQTPLHYAVRKSGCDGGEEEGDAMAIIRLLVRAGADITAKDDKGRTPLECAFSSVTEIDNLGLLLEPGEAGRAARAELASFAGTWTIGGISIQDPNAPMQSGKFEVTVQRHQRQERTPSRLSLRPPRPPATYSSTGACWESEAED